MPYAIAKRESSLVITSSKPRLGYGNRCVQSAGLNPESALRLI